MLALLGCTAPEPAVPAAQERAPAPAALNRDVTLTYSAHLLYRDPPAWLPPIRIHLPAAEWTDEDGGHHFEIREGAGTTVGVGPRGEEVPTQLRVRVERLPGAPMVREQPGVSRSYVARGEIYFWSDVFPLNEIEFVQTISVPVADGAWTVTPPALPPADADTLATLGPLVDAVERRGEGGALVSEQMTPFWGRPAPPLPLYGPLFLVEGAATPARIDTTARTADLLAGRLLYVRNDYALAVSPEGDVLNPSELDEQGTILIEARIMARQLPLTAETRERITRLGEEVMSRSRPEDVARTVDEVVASVRRELWLDLAMPDASRLSEGEALYQAHCARCHGERGEGPPPAMAALFPPPVALGSPEVAQTLSPQRVWSAATFGVPGTAMVAMGDTLDDAQRWAVAFHVLRLPATAATPPGAGTGHTLEDLALLTQEELGQDAAWWRSAGTVAAAAEPAFEARRALRAAARGGPGERAALDAIVGDGELAGVRADPTWRQLHEAADDDARAAAARVLAARLREIELAP